MDSSVDRPWPQATPHPRRPPRSRSSSCSASSTASISRPARTSSRARGAARLARRARPDRAPTSRVSAADLRRALDVREGLRALLMANNGDAARRGARGAARPGGRRAPACACASGPAREPELVPEAGGVDGALAPPAGDRGRARSSRAAGSGSRPARATAATGPSTTTRRTARAAGAGWRTAATSRRRGPSASASAARAASGAERSRPGRYSTVWTLNRFVPPAAPGGQAGRDADLVAPARPARLARRRRRRPRSGRACPSAPRGARGCTPQSSWQRRTTSRRGESASTGARGR